MDVLEDVKTEGYQEGLEVGVEKGFEKGIEKGVEVGQRRKTYFGTYNMLRKGFSSAMIADILDVPVSFVADVKKLLVQVPRTVDLLKEGKGIEKISKKLNAPILFVEAVKLELEKK